MKNQMNGIQSVGIEDRSYPALLKEIFDPPAVLYYKGNLEILKKPCVAIVGTRRTTAYGESQAFRFARELSQRGVCVVSGLAFGVDAAAHRGALEGKGGTIAVLAQNLNEIQPASHRGLAEKILGEGGLLLSEKAVGLPALSQKAAKAAYLVRNRIIAGLCPATIVIEASYKSGALNTAAHALRENRDVYALPGRLTDEQSLGTNRLIQDGAALLSSPKEILEDLGIAWEKKEPLLEGLSKDVMDELKKGPLSGAELGERFQENLSELYAVLGELELQGLIKLTRELRYAVSTGG